MIMLDLANYTKKKSPVRGKNSVTASAALSSRAISSETSSSVRENTTSGDRHPQTFVVEFGGHTLVPCGTTGGRTYVLEHIQISSVNYTEKTHIDRCE